jgi:hypothetical protein
MDEYVFDPAQDARPAPRPARRRELHTTLAREARRRAQRSGVDVIVQEARRASDLALVWFRGERTEVLRTVGGWQPGGGIELQIAHAAMNGSRYELAVYAVVAGPDGADSD